MGGLVGIVVVVLLIVFKLRDLRQEAAPKARLKAWQQDLAQGQKHPAAPSATPTKRAPVARTTSVAPAKRTKPTRTTPVLAHESRLQRDARLHRKPLQSPAYKLRPPKKRLK